MKNPTQNRFQNRFPNQTRTRWGTTDQNQNQIQTVVSAGFVVAGGSDQNQDDGHLEDSRAFLWLLILAGLSSSERTIRPPKVKPLSAKRSLVLASPEMSKLQGWFEKYIREDEHGCWIWHGARFRGGYGACGFRGTTTVAHRAIWQALYADLPRNVDLDHLCRIRACVNPDHLEPVTRSMNLTRGAHPTQGRLGRRSA